MFFLYKSTTRFHGFLTEVRGIRTHIGNVTSLVETLRQHHRLFHAEAEATARPLLQGRSDKRSVRLAGRFSLVAFFDFVLSLFQKSQRRIALLFIDWPVRNVLIALALFGDFKSNRFLFGGEICCDLPKLLGNKCTNLTLALDDNSHSDRLYSPSGEAPGHLRPKQRRYSKAYNPI